MIDGRGYWNRTTGWFCAESWVSLAFYRIWMVIRLALYIVFSILDFLYTLIFAVLWPFVVLAMTFLGSFLNFYVGLWLVEIRIDFSLFTLPALMLITWVLWALYPFVGCYMQNVIVPLIRQAAPFLTQLLTLGLVLFNVLVRVWNACVPLIGMFLAIIIELVIICFKIVVQLMGDGALFKLFGLLQQIILVLVQII